VPPLELIRKDRLWGWSVTSTGDAHAFSMDGGRRHAGFWVHSAAVSSDANSY